MQRSCNSGVVAILLFFCNKLHAQDTCCYRSEDTGAIDSINIKATFLIIDLYDTKWDLQVNISWTPVEGYNRYIVELETYSAPSSSDVFCNPLISCTFEGVLEKNWKVFTGIQFGSIQRVRVYITEVKAIEYRGPYITVYPTSPDCYDETKSIAFCKTQAVQYAGKPIAIEILNKTLNDDDNRVTIYIQWRQPAHINPDTPITFYLFEWYSKETSVNTMKIRNLVFEPGAYVITELDGLLFLNTSYTLEITPVVMANGNNKRGLTRKISFITPLPKVVLPVTENDSNAVTIALVVGGGVNLLAIIVFIILWIICTNHSGGRPYVNRRKRLDKEEVNILDLDVIFPKHSQIRPTLTAYPVYEIDRSDVSWAERKELGRGYYGEVYKCRTPINGIPTEAVIILPKRI